MNFYTYDEWLAHSYSPIDERDLVKGQKKIIEFSQRYPRALNVFSVFREVNSVEPTYPNPTLIFKNSKIDCDIGCLYKFKNNVPEGERDSGCVQVLNDELGCSDTDTFSDYPYIHLFKVGSITPPPYLEYLDCLKRESISISLNAFDSYDKILIFQSIYSGAISFSEAVTSLEFYFGDYPTSELVANNSYRYRINTNLYSATSQMIVGALLTFQTSGSGVNTKRILTIENISEFVYGHQDMAEKFGYNTLWKCFEPPKDATVMPSSIMHYSKT